MSGRHGESRPSLGVKSRVAGVVAEGGEGGERVRVDRRASRAAAAGWRVSPHSSRSNGLQNGVQRVQRHEVAGRGHHASVMAGQPEATLGPIEFNGPATHTTGAEQVEVGDPVAFARARSRWHRPVSWATGQYAEPLDGGQLGLVGEREAILEVGVEAVDVDPHLAVDLQRGPGVVRRRAGDLAAGAFGRLHGQLAGDDVVCLVPGAGVDRCAGAAVGPASGEDVVDVLECVPDRGPAGVVDVDAEVAVDLDEDVSSTISTTLSGASGCTARTM